LKLCLAYKGNLSTGVLDSKADLQVLTEHAVYYLYWAANIASNLTEPPVGVFAASGQSWLQSSACYKHCKSQALPELTIL